MPSRQKGAAGAASTNAKRADAEVSASVGKNSFVRPLPSDAGANVLRSLRVRSRGTTMIAAWLPSNPGSASDGPGADRYGVHEGFAGSLGHEPRVETIAGWAGGLLRGASRRRLP